MNSFKCLQRFYSSWMAMCLLGIGCSAHATTIIAVVGDSAITDTALANKTRLITQLMPQYKQLSEQELSAQVLESMLDDEIGATSESICPGSTIGELGLVNGIHRLTTVRVVSEHATIYSLTKENWVVLTEHHPKVARCIDLLLIRYLSHRVQHVSNGNICGGRSLPV